MKDESCPSCGFDLGFKPSDKGGPSDEICPCCGIQFGYDDAAGGAPVAGRLSTGTRGPWQLPA
jgi:hypothetical protein